MKTILRLAFWAFFTVVFTSCADQSQYREWGLKGKVKSMTETQYDAEQKFGKWQPGDKMPYGHYAVYFDEKGWVTEIDYFDDEDKLTQKVVPVRENGKVTGEIFYNSEGKPESTTKVRYLSKNELECESVGVDGNIIWSSKSFLENGLTVKQTITLYNNGEKREGYTVLATRDDNDNLVSQSQITEEGDTYVSLYEYLEYDDKGNWTKALRYRNGTVSGMVVRQIQY